MASIWKQNTTSVMHSTLTQNLTADAVVIGGGLCGILISYFLQKQGIDTIILEANYVGSGQTQGTTAKISAQHALLYHNFIHRIGKQRAKAYFDACQLAISEYKRVIQQEYISCQWETCPSYLFTTSDYTSLNLEYEAARSLHIPITVTKNTALPFAVKGALRLEQQAQFHPLEFLYALSKKMKIYEHTPVMHVDKNNVITAYGTIHAKHIIFATHYPFQNRTGAYGIRLSQERSYVLALKHAASLDGMYLSIDSERLSLRNSGSLLLIGGYGHRTGIHPIESSYEALAKIADTYYKDSEITAKWSAQDCMPVDGIPYIGRFSPYTPNWFVATGFGTWGMTGSMISALLVRDYIIKKPNAYHALFSPNRHTIRGNTKNILTHVFYSAKGYAKSILPASIGELSRLEKEEGGIFQVNGTKLGAYKDSSGTLYLVSTTCPHMGCQLEWNIDEKSWDCPCHGSRFDYQGKLLDNPAVKSVKISSKL